MVDPYFLQKVHGWNSMILWINSNKPSFRDFCKNNKMDYMLYMGYIPFLQKMNSDEDRLIFITKKINHCENALQEEYNRIESNQSNQSNQPNQYTNYCIYHNKGDNRT